MMKQVIDQLMYSDIFKH